MIQKGKINYIIAALATTFVNYIVYILLTRLAGVGEIWGNILAWAASVAFAYIVNRVFVFESKSVNIAAPIRFSAISQKPSTDILPAAASSK